MPDAAQTALFVIIIILTILLVVLGVQVFFILRDFRKTIQKANSILDDAEGITQSISEPINTFSTLLMGLKTGAAFMDMFKSKKSKRNSDKD